MALAEVIQYEGDNKTFIWKHPRGEFNWGSQLIVHESQEAVFFMNGQALPMSFIFMESLQRFALPMIKRKLTV